MSEKIVRTYTGLKEPRKNCKYIKGDFYKIGDPKIVDSGECYYVEGKYYRLNSGYIEYDYEERSYVLVHKTTLKTGIVDFDTKEEKFVSGMFSPNITENIYIANNVSSAKSLCISEDVAKKGKYRERFCSGTFLPRKLKSSNWFTSIKSAPISKSSLHYESRFVSKLTESEHLKTYKPEQDNTQLNMLGDFLNKNGITFGVEFETSIGFIPERLCYKYGLIPLRDGSIQGLEYVTIPLSGRNGLYALRDICKEMSKRTKHDHSCALHIHLGGLERTKKSITSAFILSLLVQDDIMTTQPVYKSRKLGGRKMYCKLLNKSYLTAFKKEDDLDKIFKGIFRFVSDGKEFSHYTNDLSNVDTHPSDPSGSRKWEILSRYFWINFVPIVFGNKKTVEFRHHNITTEFEKVIQLLFESAVFIWSAQNMADEILNLDSPLAKLLISKPHNSRSNLLDFFLKQETNSKLVKIANRYKKYIEIRKGIMVELATKEDHYGEKELSYNKRYSKLDKSFWE